MSTRTDRIDAAVSAASELIGFLQDEGPVNGAKARLIVEAAVPNARDWEVKESALASDVIRGRGKWPITMKSYSARSTLLLPNTTRPNGP
jgi:hypothetical protein